jgi:beta-phosphoglucomutase
MIRLNAVILDMDGLMLDTEGLYKSAWQRAAVQLGFVLDEPFYFTLIGRTNAAAEIALTERFGPNFPLLAFRKRWAELWREDAESSGIELKPGLLELLEYLAARKIPTAVATSSDQEYAAFSLRAARLDTRRFAHVVTGEQVEKGKPAPHIYLEAARRLGVNPARCLALEDSDAGIESASAAGMNSPDGARPESAVSSGTREGVPSLNVAARGGSVAVRVGCVEA